MSDEPAGIARRPRRVDTAFDLVHRSLDGVGRWARRLRILVWILIGGSGFIGLAWIVAFLTLSEGGTRVVGTLFSLVVFGGAVGLLAFTAWCLGGVMGLPDFVAGALRAHTGTAQALVDELGTTPRHRTAVRSSIAALRATRDAKDVAMTVRRVLPVASGITLLLSAIALAVVLWGAVFLPVLLVALGTT